MSADEESASCAGAISSRPLFAEAKRDPFFAKRKNGQLETEKAKRSFADEEI